MHIPAEVKIYIFCFCMTYFKALVFKASCHLPSFALMPSIDSSTNIISYANNMYIKVPPVEY